MISEKEIEKYIGKTTKIEGNLNKEIKASILKRAAVLEKEAKSKKDD